MVELKRQIDVISKSSQHAKREMQKMNSVIEENRVSVVSAKLDSSFVLEQNNVSVLSKSNVNSFLVGTHVASNQNDVNASYDSSTEFLK